MKKLGIAIIVIICLAAFKAGNDNNTFKKLYALEGTWKMVTKRGAVCEEWKKVNENLLQGKGYMIRGTDTIINERITLTNTGEGIFYTPVVETQNDKKPIAFKMTKGEGNTFVFENPEHDFPKRIMYHIVTTDSIHAIIDDGTDAGKKQNFFFKRQ